MLRERGHSEDAERLRSGELMTMVAAVRMPAETDAAISERLNAVFAIEAERVANAAVLAELLLPTLVEKLQLQSRPQTVLDESPVAPISLAQPAPVEKPAAPRAASIADFIDEMIAQEKPPPRPSSGTQRRAS